MRPPTSPDVNNFNGGVLHCHVAVIRVRGHDRLNATATPSGTNLLDGPRISGYRTKGPKQKTEFLSPPRYSSSFLCPPLYIYLHLSAFNSLFASISVRLSRLFVLCPDLRNRTYCLGTACEEGTHWSSLGHACQRWWEKGQHSGRLGASTFQKWKHLSPIAGRNRKVRQIPEAIQSSEKFIQNESSWREGSFQSQNTDHDNVPRWLQETSKYIVLPNG